MLQSSKKNVKDLTTKIVTMTVKFAIQQSIIFDTHTTVLEAVHQRLPWVCKWQLDTTMTNSVSSNYCKTSASAVNHNWTYYLAATLHTVTGLTDILPGEPVVHLTLHFHFLQTCASSWDRPEHFASSLIPYQKSILTKNHSSRSLHGALREMRKHDMNHRRQLTFLTKTVEVSDLP